MRLIRFISYIFIISLVSSCMAYDSLWMDKEIPEPDMIPPFLISGQVLDVEDNPIEHIKVTIDWDGGLDDVINYTASDGTFTAGVPYNEEEQSIEFTITLEDIDGEDNGGLFETVTDKVIYSMDYESPSGFITYRLNRATASASSPQS